MAQLDPNPPVKGQTYEAWYEGGVVGVYTNDGDTYLYESGCRMGSASSVLAEGGYRVAGNWRSEDGWQKTTVEFVGQP